MRTFSTTIGVAMVVGYLGVFGWPGGSVSPFGFPTACGDEVGKDDGERDTLSVAWDGTGNYLTIQEALDASTNGDTIVVMPSVGAPSGAYLENVIFPAKTVTLRSLDPHDPGVVATTVIDGNAAGRVVSFAVGATASAVLDGLTIRNGRALSGSGILCSSASPTILRCVITDNHAVDGTHQVVGGAVSGFDSDATLAECTISRNVIESSLDGFGSVGFLRGAPTITDCLIVENTTNATNIAYAGGLYLFDSDATVTGCTIAGNRCIAGGLAEGGGIGLSDDSTVVIASCTIADNILVAPTTYGGGLRCVWNAKPILSNCTITGNTADYGAAIWCYNSGTSVEMRNCIVWDNTALAGPPIDVDSGASLTLAYCDIQGGASAVRLGAGASVDWQGGNIDADPLFADADGPDGDPNTWDDNDFHLQPGSPCISAGDPEFAPLPGETDVDGQARVQGCRVDIGSDETELGLAGDHDNDGDVDADDYSALESCLAGPEIGYATACICADHDGDGDVDLADFAAFQTLAGM